MSQAALAEQLGMRQGTISRAERGLDMRVATLVELAHALDLDVFLAPRRVRPVIERLIAGSAGPTLPAVYTGGGDEPYSEVDDPAAHRAWEASHGPVNRKRAGR